MKKYTLFLFIFVFGFGLFINVHSVGASSNCTISNTLRVGSRGAQVVCLQASLGLNADGKFGRMTKASVMAWQKARGLVADGVFGARSRAIWFAEQNPSLSSVTISGVSGPQSLNVNQTGTWTITASDRNGGNLSYSVFWGDETYAYPSPMTSGASLPVQQSVTFTHSYMQAGMYRPTFTATNNVVCIAYPCPNSSANTSLSVNVGGTTTTINPTISSLSLNSGAVGSQVTISGDNFTATGNKIKFGDTNSENDPAYNLNSNNIVCVRYPCPGSENNGKSITFTVPSTYYVACLSAKPACEVATRMVQPGVYPVSVINANGTSNLLNFTVTSSGY